MPSGSLVGCKGARPSRELEPNIAVGTLKATRPRRKSAAAATKDARNAALQFARDSGSRVGSIRNASQGGFQITAPGLDSDDPKSARKNVRVVTSADYELKD